MELQIILWAFLSDKMSKPNIIKIRKYLSNVLKI